MNPYTIYLAGPMSNIPEFNFPKFFDAASYLRLVHGWDVLSPAEKDLESIPWAEMVNVPGFDTGNLALYVENSSFTMANAMEWDLPAIQKSDGIVLLDGWETSTGARWERAVAEALDRDIWLLSDEAGVTGLREWHLRKDIDPKQLTTFMKGFGIDPGPEPWEVIAEAAHQGIVSIKPFHDLLKREVEAREADNDAHYQSILDAITDEPVPPFGTHISPPRVTDDPDSGRTASGLNMPYHPGYMRADIERDTVSGEVRVIDPNTGGAKGAKAQAMHLIPGDALLAISEHLNKGAEKYAERNWELGYAWSLSFAAMQRHLWAWWQGQDDDPEFGWSHLRAVGFHALVLLAFELRGAGTDDRPGAHCQCCGDGSETPAQPGEVT